MYKHVFRRMVQREDINLGDTKISLGLPCGSDVKYLRAIQGTQIQALDQEDPLEKGMATHSSILAWEIP